MPKENGVGFRIGQTLTDENGKYSMRIPVPIERLHISIDSRTVKGKYLQGIPKNASEELQSNPTSVRGEKVTKDATVDFVYSNGK